MFKFVKLLYVCFACAGIQESVLCYLFRFVRQLRD